jgi:DNA-binding HxlR family transcriptional regulator
VDSLRHLREQAITGIRRFSDFQKSLGLAKNVLSTRLKKLVACGIMRQVPASDGSAYREYALTQKGWVLFPVIVALGQWGASYLFSRGEKRLLVLDKRSGKPLDVYGAQPPLATQTQRFGKPPPSVFTTVKGSLTSRYGSVRSSPSASVKDAAQILPGRTLAQSVAKPYMRRIAVEPWMPSH